VIIVEVPVETPAAGSPKSARTVKPGQYPVNKREAWHPRKARRQFYPRHLETERGHPRIFTPSP